MHLNSEEKVEIFEKYGKGKTDTGSPEAQIALFSVRIAHLTQHLKSNHKDYSTARALKCSLVNVVVFLTTSRKKTSTAIVQSSHKKSSVSESKPQALLEDYKKSIAIAMLFSFYISI